MTSRLMNRGIREPIEQKVSEYYGDTWRVHTCQNLNDLASHHCALLSDGAHTVFAKLSEAANGLDQFEVELAGLRFLARTAGVLIPAPIGSVPVEGGVVLVLEAAKEVERTPLRWRQMGQTLAQIHQIKGEVFGFPTQGYFGPLYQDNRPADGWLEFYTERRLWPRFMGAIDSGHLPTDVIRQVEKLIHRLPRLDLPQAAPCLLHGDAQQNNYISTTQGAMVIDPAIYYGNPEIDLAYIDYFQPVPEDFLNGYKEILPIDSGFPERRDLWRVSAYLAAVEVEGSSHLEKRCQAVEKYL